MYSVCRLQTWVEQTTAKSRTKVLLNDQLTNGGNLDLDSINFINYVFGFFKCLHALLRSWYRCTLRMELGGGLSNGTTPSSRTLGVMVMISLGMRRSEWPERVGYREGTLVY